mmetsp:Transcript_3937/g.8686  ORF Transcript_3937/g.8686 Transcript_3937/m.8686 type:complete len:207 (+) Transcript_3937:3128-3748(+)
MSSFSQVGIVSLLVQLPSLNKVHIGVSTGLEHPRINPETSLARSSFPTTSINLFTFNGIGRSSGRPGKNLFMHLRVLPPWKHSSATCMSFAKLFTNCAAPVFNALISCNAGPVSEMSLSPSPFRGFNTLDTFASAVSIIAKGAIPSPFSFWRIGAMKKSTALLTRFSSQETIEWKICFNQLMIFPIQLEMKCKKSCAETLKPTWKV